MLRGMSRLRELLRRRIAEPVFSQLRQGITPSKLAFSMALGVTLSAMPVLGVTTLLSVALAAALRLNQPAILAANYLSTPLQILLFVPFFRAGAWLFGAPPVSFSFEQVRAEFALGAWATVARYGDASLRAVFAWALVAPVLTAILYGVLRPILQRLPIRSG
jgi:uncharacterized protein (DUF2062 family)